MQGELRVKKESIVQHSGTWKETEGHSLQFLHNVGQNQCRILAATSYCPTLAQIMPADVDMMKL